MFERVKYKKAAKMTLAGNWVTVIIMTLISIAVMSLCQFAVNYIDKTSDIDRFVSASDNSFVSGIGILQVISLLLTVASSVFIIAQAYSYIKLVSKKEKKLTLDTFFEGFTLWFKGILASIWRSIWVFLWSLLFIIPGIVKAFSYSQLMFIIAENPKISVTKALRISKVLTQGHKADLLCMNLSFIGWLFLCVFPPVIFYVVPYYFTSFTFSYKHLKAMAIAEGRISQKDFE